MVKRGRDVSEGVCGSSLPLQRTFEFCVILAPWQGPSETAISLSLRLRRFRGRRQTVWCVRSDEMQSAVRPPDPEDQRNTGRRLELGRPNFGAEPFVNRSLLP